MRGRVGQAIRGIEGRWLLAFAAMTVVLTWAYVTHPEGRFTRGGLIHGDGAYYYAWLPSLWFDADLSLANNYADLGNPHHRGDGPRGLAENPFTVGTALLWSPLFLLGRLLAALAGIDPQGGAAPIIQRVTLFGSVLMALGTAGAVAFLARRYVGELAAAVAAGAVLLATPLTWYAVYQPHFSHAASALTVAVFVVVWWTGRDRPSVRRALALGLLGGLAAMVRPQNALFVFLPLLEVGRIGLIRKRWPAVGVVVVYGAGVALGFSPQMYVWWTIYGAPLTVPQGGGFLHPWHSEWSLALFSSRNGLFAWTPVAYVGVVALALHGLRRGEAAPLCGWLLLVFAAHSFINGAVDDWWAGWAFGGRRFVGSTVAFGLGIALATAGLQRLLHRFWLRRGAGVALLACFSWCNVGYMDAYMFGRFRRGEPVAMREQSRIVWGPLVDPVYDVLGHPWSAPASWVFAWRAGVEPEVYDRAAPLILLTGRGNERGWEYLRMPDARWAMGGFGPRVEIQRQPASVMEEQDATLLLPMRLPADVEVTAYVRPAGEGVSLSVTSRGQVVFDEQLRPGWRLIRFHIPASALDSGVNYLRLHQTPLHSEGGVAWGFWTVARPGVKPVLPPLLGIGR